MNGWRLYWRYAGLSWRAQLQYRVSFLLQLAGTTLISVSEFLAILVLFARFDRLGRWTLAEVAMFYGTVNVTWALAEGIGRGFDDFGSLVKSGDFDRVLLRPRSTVLQVLGREFTLRRLGRIAQGAAVLAWGWHALGIGWQTGKLLLLAWAVVGGVGVFLGLLIFQATLAFWTIESLEVMNVMTYGGVTTAQYPLAIYPGWLRRFFIYGVPLGCAAYFPLLAVIGCEDPLGTSRAWQTASPVAGLIFFGLSLLAWRRGLRRYASTGS
jgi:ABC-2 type transport system permease protein